METGQALTGLLRRSDDAAARLPLSVLPLGSCSTAGRALWGIKESPQPRHLLEATMAVVRQVLSPMDVMEVQPIATSPEESPAKPIYASTLEWGAYRDAWERRDKYWYWASLRRYVTYLFSSYKDLSWDCSCKITYTRPCAGCSLCHVSPAIAAAQKDNSSVRTKRWYHYLLPNMGSMKRFSNQHDTSLPHTRAAEDRSSVSNPSCGEVHEETVERVCDVRVCTRNTEHTSRLQPHQLLFGTGASDTSATQFIREGWNRTHSGEPSNPRQELVGSITIVPSGDTKNKSGEEREFYVDGEGYEVRPCTIRARPNAVSIFAPPLATAA
ncbi:NAD kinase/diacylglycerol kinase-like domain [Trinorchestia longiramus]|nr:NAD kinase/diacylglycerol kinase-like domain [Trinorchestia longiramus]